MSAGSTSLCSKLAAKLAAAVGDEGATSHTHVDATEGTDTVSRRSTVCKIIDNRIRRYVKKNFFYAFAAAEAILTPYLEVTEHAKHYLRYCVNVCIILVLCLYYYTLRSIRYHCNV